MFFKFPIGYLLLIVAAVQSFSFTSRSQLLPAHRLAKSSSFLQKKSCISSVRHRPSAIRHAKQISFGSDMLSLTRSPSNRYGVSWAARISDIGLVPVLAMTVITSWVLSVGFRGMDVYAANVMLFLEQNVKRVLCALGFMTEQNIENSGLLFEDEEFQQSSQQRGMGRFDNNNNNYNSYNHPNRVVDNEPIAEDALTKEYVKAKLSEIESYLSSRNAQ